VTRHSDAVVQAARADGAGPALYHVMVVGGTPAEWTELQPGDWEKRIDELGSYCASIGVPWLTIRVYGPDGDPDLAVPAEGRHDVGGCSVAIDPYGSGRQRFAAAIDVIDPAVEITEASVAVALYGPAESEPDLLVVLGPPTQLPPSLVWELAYAELVFDPTPWIDFGAAELASAVVDFAGRRRRFGGLDDE
jgi:undecaprenyl diphosphate synthase